MSRAIEEARAIELLNRKCDRAIRRSDSLAGASYRAGLAKRVLLRTLRQTPIMRAFIRVVRLFSV